MAANSANSDDILISVSTDLTTIKRQLRQLGQDITAATGGIQKQFEGVGRGIDKSMTTALQVRINDMVGIAQKGAKQWEGILADQGKEMDRLRAKYNPVFATISRYRATVAEVQAAHRVGAISAGEMTSAISRERQAALSSIAALKQRNEVIADTPAVSGSHRFNTANIAAQFQDIAVMTQMGIASPMTIALQQGTQLSAVFNQMGGARDIVRGIGAAFLSIVNPVSLVTIGVTAAGVAAYQYFSAVDDGTAKSAEALKAQADLIQQVAQKWGDALPSVKAYADEQDRLSERKQVQDATAITVDKAWEQARAQIDEAKSSVDNLVGQLGRVPGYQNGVVELQRAFGSLSDGVKAGKTATDDLDRVSQALSNLYGQTQIPIVNDLAEAFANLSDKIAKANQAATLAKAEANLKDLQSQLPVLGTVAPVFSSGGKFINEDELQTVRADATKSQFQIEQERLAKQHPKTPRTRAPVKTADDRFFEDIEAIKARTTALIEEKAQLGMTFEAQTKRKIAFDLEQRALRDVREEARRKGDQDWQNAKLAPEQVRQIEEVSAAYAKQAEALRQAQEAQDLQRDILKGMFGDLRSALEDGKITAEEWGNIFGSVLDKIIDKIENDLIDAIFSANSAMKGGGGGGIGGLFSGLFGGGGGLGGLTWDSWDSGGYTGPGGKYETAGFVHKGEVVFDQEAVRNAGGPAVLESLRRSLKGYAEGGPVGLPSIPAIRPRGGASEAANDNRQYNIDARGAQQGVGAEIRKALEEYDRKTLPRSWNRINQDRRAIG